jgi:outer membrane protein assembly factor BamB
MSIRQWLKSSSICIRFHKKMKKAKGEKKMKLKSSKILTIAIIALFACSAFAVLPLKASEFPNVPTWSYLLAVPDYVGLGQSVFLTAWVDKVPPNAAMYSGDRWVNITIYVTNPDGSKTTIGPLTTDSAGGVSTTFMPTMTGNYSAYMVFPGQTITGNAGNPHFPINPNDKTIGDYYGPSTSPIIHFTVGDEPATMIAENPLPTNYWETPVEAFNHWWYVLNGNWYGFADVNFANTGCYSVEGNFNPYSQAPTTSHLVWTRPQMPGAPGGQMGGEFGGNSETNYFTGFEYQPKFAPIILNGVLYYEYVPGSLRSTVGSAGQGWVAVDLFTGETLWTKNYLNYFGDGQNDALRCGQIMVYNHNPNYYGGNAYLWATRTNATANYYDLFDAATGNYITSVSGAPPKGNGLTIVEGEYGELLCYYINATAIPSNNTQLQSLTLWNSSKCLSTGSTGQPDPIQNKPVQWSQGIEWTVELPNSYEGTPFGNVMANGVAQPSGFLLGTEGPYTYTFDLENQIVVMSAAQGQYTRWEWQTGWTIDAAYSLTDGKQLWITNRTQTPYTTLMWCSGASNGTYAVYNKETLNWMGYSTLTGERKWGPTETYNNDLAYYNDQSSFCAYGNLYAWTFGGEVYCYDMATGQKEWNWSTGSTGLNNPYGVNTLWMQGTYDATIADHVLFVHAGHNYGPPLYNGAEVYALNTTDGTLIWSMRNYATSGSMPISCGHFLTMNAYDNQIYAYAKGSTKTTICAPQTGVTTATPVTITGTIMDISPGASQTEVANNYPNGLPCVSDDSMSDFMEAVYEQCAMPINITGVPITISVVDGNGNYREIGQTTSSPSGTFGFTWTPDIAGDYTLYASFAGSGAYYSSSAETYFHASDAPTPAPTAQAQTGLATTSDVLTYIAAATVAIIIAIAVAVVLLMKKKA